MKDGEKQTDWRMNRPGDDDLKLYEPSKVYDGVSASDLIGCIERAGGSAPQTTDLYCGLMHRC